MRGVRGFGVQKFDVERHNMICLENSCKSCCASIAHFSQNGICATAAHLKWGIAAIVIIVLQAASAPAITLIDEFSDDQFQQAFGADGNFDSGLSLPTATIIGLTRGVYVQKTAGSTKETKAIKVDVDASVSNLTLSRDAGIDGRGLVQWDGGLLAPVAYDPRSNLSFLLGGGAGVNLTAGGSAGLLVKVVAADLPGQQLRFTLFGANNTIASDAVINVPIVAGPPQLVQIPWALFSQTSIGNGAVFNAAAAANPSQVFAVTMSITGPDDAEVSLDFVSTYVPEPSSAALLAAGGLAGICSLKRRRQSTELT